MDWTIIDKITTHPAFISVVTVLTLLGSALLVLSQTSIGKKALGKLTELISGIKTKVDNTKKLVDESLDKVSEVKEEIVNFKNEIQNEVKTYFAQFEYFESSIFGVLSEIPNARVQDKVKEIYSKWQSKKKEIEDFIGGSFIEFDTKLKILEEQKDTQIANLNNEIENIKELLKNSLKQVENGENEERKDTSNEETTKE